MASRRLWLARVCAVRSAELEGLGQMAVISALVVLTAGQLTDFDAPDRYALVGALYSFALVTTLRAAYSGWLRRARRDGRFARRLVLMGANAQSFDLARLIGRHPETGFDIVGACGPRSLVADMDSGVPWLGKYREASAVVSRSGATGALVVASAFEPTDLNRTLRQLLGSGCHVHLSSGVRGISHERLLPLPLAREPLFSQRYSRPWGRARDRRTGSKVRQPPVGRCHSHSDGAGRVWTMLTSRHRRSDATGRELYSRRST